MSNEIKAADERARKSASDCERLANELRSEQEHSHQIEKLRKGMESTVKDLQVRLDEAEAQALKGGKKLIAKLEHRVSLIFFRWGDAMLPSDIFSMHKIYDSVK